MALGFHGEKFGHKKICIEKFVGVVVPPCTQDGRPH